MSRYDTFWLALWAIAVVVAVSGYSAWRDYQARKQQALLDRRSAMRRKLDEEMKRFRQADDEAKR